MVDNRPPVSGLLQAWSRGDLVARDALLPLVYEELRRRAARYLRRERRGHTLQPTALVHEAYLRLADQRRMTWRNRSQFFGVAAQMMRRILVDHARAQRAAKRPGAAWRVSLDERVATAPPPDCDVLLLDQALEELTQIDARQGRIVELRYFGGLSEHEIGDALGVSRSTVAREWETAKAWLFLRMTRGKGEARR